MIPHHTARLPFLNREQGQEFFYTLWQSPGQPVLELGILQKGFFLGPGQIGVFNLALLFLLLGAWMLVRLGLRMAIGHLFGRTILRFTLQFLRMLTIFIPLAHLDCSPLPSIFQTRVWTPTA